MEKPCAESTSFSSYGDQYRTQWLQTTLTDLEEKMKAIKASVEDGNGSEHRKKSELIKMFKEFGNFYHSLVKKYDELRSNTFHGYKFRSGSSATNDKRGTQIQSRIADISSTEKDIDDLETIENEAKYSYALDTLWPNVSEAELQITKLTEDNLKQLAELIRRNDEKRETIKRLQAQLEELRRENTLLRFSVRHSSADAESKEAYISRPRRIALLFRACSP